MFYSEVSLSSVLCSVRIKTHTRELETWHKSLRGEAKAATQLPRSHNCWGRKEFFVFTGTSAQGWWVA